MRRAPTIAEVLRLVELRTKIVSASSLLLGTAWAAVAHHRFSAGTFALMALATLFVDAGTAGFNSYFDFVRGVDTPRSDVERYKVLVHEPLEPRVALAIASAAFLVAAALGATLGARVGWSVVAIGAGAMLVAFLYSGGPLPISATPLGELFAGGALGGVLVVLASYVQARTVDRGAILLGIPSTVLIASILTVNNTCDIEGDSAAGRRTLAIVVGAASSSRIIDALVVGSHLAAIALVPLGVLPALALAPLAISLALAARALRRMHRRGYAHATKPASMQSISAVFVVQSLALLGGLGLSAAGAR